ncbi:DUF368 domain-containing protein [Oceanobacillus sp. J11TS1]|uniref:DUF368 domain-containing protein n=1 Tax=Oceanobacillus sp. J11TS1 TaxID=2807191 RepID=UPI001B2C8E0A|nr:DUF368 domain-containing protein [Oceanobacillus sp. J11TS1]GIO24348.1 DUF368 domain-containing protein [Oceanobacillus sp. J11TS1]
MEWRNLYRGLIMGSVEVVPGISGGTIAVLLGIYEQLIASISGFFSKDWKKHLSFLVPLGIGMVIAIFLFAKVIEWLFKYYPMQTQFFFLGLVIGVIPYLYQKAEGKTKFQAKQYILLVIGFVIVSGVGILNPNEGQAIQGISISTYVLLFVAGFIGSSVMIVPGISGSMIMMLFGVYPTIMGAISNFQFSIIIVAGTGIALGFITMSKIIAYFLRNYFTSTYAIIIGLVIGAITVVFPGVPVGAGNIIVCVLLFAGGLIAALALGRLEYK